MSTPANRDKCADYLGEAMELLVRAKQTWSASDTAVRREEFFVAANHTTEWLCMLAEINANRR